MNQPDLALRITTAESDNHDLADLLHRLASAASSYANTTSNFQGAKPERLLLRSLLSETQGILLKRGSA